MTPQTIKACANPNATHDYIVQHDFTVTAAGRSLKLCIRMVPDREVADASSLKTYLESFRGSDAALEKLAGHILDDLLNRFIPRFLHIELVYEQNGQSHRIVMEEKQPKWTNPELLRASRLSRHDF